MPKCHSEEGKSPQRSSSHGGFSMYRAMMCCCVLVHFFIVKYYCLILTWLNNSNKIQEGKFELNSTACVQEGHTEQACREVRSAFPRGFSLNRPRTQLSVHMNSNFPGGRCRRVPGSAQQGEMWLQWLAASYWNENPSRYQLEALQGLHFWLGRSKTEKPLRILQTSLQCW